ncbi:hypothetical protein [Pseudomonas sp. OA65]|uniref:hypothetical protein n=1 Tax=Pseudomonas sp. OA65 TaxID=2818431 RepID=UPI001A9E6C2E|nr:hypothetical protein [Pseudomonas sp. OA65]MBO1539981.1 hypothetical protein [Pseudomonas sp. OA65]
MSISKMIFVGFMAVFGCLGNSIMAADMPQGIIKLSANEDGGGKSCALIIREGTAVQNFYMGNTACANDEARYFALENVPSATLIRFDDSPCDKYADQYMFTIKTIVHPTETRRIGLRELKDARVDSIIVRGVQLVKKENEGGFQDGKLSCVKVWRSALP